MTRPIVSARKVGKSFYRHPALIDVDIDVLPSERGLHQMVEILNLHALSELDAIMRIGRGDDHPRNFAELVAYTRKLRDGHRDAVYCILDKSYLGIGKQVRRGLELLGYGRSKPKPAEGA